MLPRPPDADGAPVPPSTVAYQARLCTPAGDPEVGRIVCAPFDRNESVAHGAKTGLAHTWHDPLVNGINDVQELSKTHFQVTLPVYASGIRTGDEFGSARARQFDGAVRSIPTAAQCGFGVRCAGLGPLRLPTSP